jgi:Protein of unknown function (DUF3987)
MCKPDIKNWPNPLSEDARYGLAGDFLRLIEPHTEADSAAILVQFLVAIGNVIGRGLHYRVEANRHALNLFAVIVGASSKARKGTSWGHVQGLVCKADETWQIQTGLSSGEGLIHNVRDGAGIADKRVLVVESEFASMLRAASRNGNTLSAIVRQAWDGGIMQVITKHFPETATDAHISIVAHITQAELQKELTGTDSRNGFANRFLWVCASRSQYLPEGGRVPQDALEVIEARLREVVAHWQGVGELELQRDEDARAHWHSIYRELSGDRPDSNGDSVSRSEAQVMRLACIYAALDRADVVRLPHLRAAVAVWDYCEASARCLFERGVIDPVEVKISAALTRNAEGMSRTEINRLFSGNLSAVKIAQALDSLTKSGYAEMRPSSTLGRPEQRWFALRGEEKASMT